MLYAVDQITTNVLNVKEGDVYLGNVEQKNVQTSEGNLFSANIRLNIQNRNTNIIDVTFFTDHET